VYNFLIGCGRAFLATARRQVPQGMINGTRNGTASPRSAAWPNSAKSISGKANGVRQEYSARNLQLGIEGAILSASTTLASMRTQTDRLYGSSAR
jgi:hypothetical protein